MSWARLVLAGVLVVGSASVSAAECAWILWIENVIGKTVRSTGGVFWYIEDSYPTNTECISDRDREFSTMGAIKMSDPDVKDLKQNKEDFVLLFTEQGNHHMYKWHCLPDTFDPRGKK